MTAHGTKGRAARRAHAPRARLGAALVALCLALPSLAHAQSEADKTEARQLAIDANAALEQKDYATAADKFARADKLFHAPTLLLGYARAQMGLGRLVTALEAYRRIVAEGIPEGASTQFVEALDEAKREVAALEQRIPTVTLNVVGARNAEVTLDGAPLAPAQIGVRVAVSPGAHVVRAAAAGHVPQERSFSIAEGSHEKFALFLEPEGAKPAAPEPDKGPGAAPALRTVGAVALVVGGIAVVGGGVAGGLAIREHGFLVDDCKKNKCPSSRQSTLDNFHTLATLSTIGIVAGGVAAAGGVVLLVVFPAPEEPAAPAKRASANRAWVAPTLGVGSAGLVGGF